MYAVHKCRYEIRHTGGLGGGYIHPYDRLKQRNYGLGRDLRAEYLNFFTIRVYIYDIFKLNSGSIIEN